MRCMARLASHAFSFIEHLYPILSSRKEWYDMKTIQQPVLFFYTLER